MNVDVEGKFMNDEDFECKMHMESPNRFSSSSDEDDFSRC